MHKEIRCLAGARHFIPLVHSFGRDIKGKVHRMSINWNQVRLWMGAPFLCYDVPNDLPEAFAMADLASGLIRLQNK